MTDICRHLGHARTTYYRRATPQAIDTNAVKLRAAARHIHADVHAQRMVVGVCVLNLMHKVLRLAVTKCVASCNHYN